VLRAYVDASSRELVRASDGEKGDLLTVAGYLFESRQRARVFCQRWSETFRATEPFSWADLVACQRPFEYLRDGNGKVIRKDLDPLVASGISLVNEFVVAGTVASCWKQDVERHGPTWIKGFGHAYSVAGHMAMAGLGACVKRNNQRDGIAYLIEAGDEGYDQLNHLLSYAAKSPEVAAMYQWRSHGVLRKVANSPFHAPDAFAWEWGKYITETVVEHKRPMRRSLVNLLRNRLQFYSLQHLHGEPLLRFFSRIHALGVEQMQEDAEALKSVESLDVTENLCASEPPEPAEGQQ
jgi:hypothetical protein